MVRQFSFVFFVFLMSYLFWSCEESLQKNNLEVVSEEIMQEVRFSDEFLIKIPNHFIKMDDINPNAIVQYGAINKEKDSTKENFEDEIYVTIMELLKDDLINTFADSGRITLNKMNNRTAINLELILEDFEMSNYLPKPEIINGLTAIQNEFSGRLGQYEVYYKMGIYETSSHYYQLLIWCMKKHVSKHVIEMDAIIHSFENV